jgi:hypothetical protein
LFDSTERLPEVALAVILSRVAVGLEVGRMYHGFRGGWIRRAGGVVRPRRSWPSVVATTVAWPAAAAARWTAS